MCINLEVYMLHVSRNVYLVMYTCTCNLVARYCINLEVYMIYVYVTR